MAPGGKAKDERAGKSGAGWPLDEEQVPGFKGLAVVFGRRNLFLLLKEIRRIEVDDAIFLAFVAEKPRGAVAVSGLFATPFAAEFLKTATMAEAPAQVLVHLVVGSNVDGIFETGAGAAQRFFLRHRLLPPLPSHGDNGGGDGGHEEKIDHRGTTTPERYDSRILHGRQQQRELGSQEH